ncbi:hypothetical protein [Microbacterium murale]|uniref:Uncharacterized protein n=1 Tax=Microbacterium murale TaxID=1081040 RepID=A0ABQ1RXX5_9MICO|nr:hypothetical protein [Microbacterium murale]GGD83190.1 hypothetical protein GCM10007269_27550 [Microbacterium murale]
MALTELGLKIDTIRDRIQPIRNTLTSAIESTRSNGRITQPTKRQEIAQHYLTAKKNLELLLEDERRATQAKRSELERAIFGRKNNGATEIMAYRDAQERALQFGPDDEEQASELFHIAEINDDESLVSALLARSLHFQWEAIIAKHAAAYPERREHLTDLADIDRWTTQHEDDGFNGYQGIYSIPVPKEVSGFINDAGIQKIAQGD